MKMKVMTDLQKLSYDLYKGNLEKYSKEEASKAIKNAVFEACGGEWDFYSFQENKWSVYRVLTEVLSVGLGELIIERFNDFAEVHDTDLGDSVEFIVENQDLFRVATIADGNTDIRRQKLYNGKMTVVTEKLAIKIYEELDRFLAGRIDWNKMVDRVMVSYSHDIAIRIYNAIYGSYDSLKAPYVTSGVFAEDQLTGIIAHVEAATGQEAAVYGTKTALAKITSANPSDGMKDRLNLLGHYGTFRGTNLLELPQGHKAGTDNFVVDDDFLLVVPAGEKIVKIVLEGDAYMYDTEAGQRNDEQIEFFFGRKAGVGVVEAKQFGIYRLS